MTTKTGNSKEQATLRLLPYRADQINLNILYSHLDKNQQQRFNSLRGNRKIEFGVTRLFLKDCLTS